MNLRKPKLDRQAFGRAVLSSISRLLGVALGAGAGSLLYRIVGGSTAGVSVAICLAIASFVLILIVEYEREAH